MTMHHSVSPLTRALCTLACATLTACGNDLGFDALFERQIEADELQIIESFLPKQMDRAEVVEYIKGVIYINCLRDG